MPASEFPSDHDTTGPDVLTLPEVATYLRATEEAVLELVTRDALPGQRVGGEWRFLKRAVVEWLRFGSLFRPEFRMFPPPWTPGHPFWEGMLHVLEQRIFSKHPVPERPVAKPGSKHAVAKHFGVFKADADIEEQLAGLRARREAGE